MIEITGVKPLRRHLYAVYSEDGFVASLDEQTFLSAALKIGSVIAENEMEQLIRASNRRKAEQKALRLLEYRDHSKAELEKKLRAVSDEESAAQTADKMEQLGLVDDSGYAARLASSLIFEKLYSRRRAVSELRAKGIDAETAQAALDETDSDDAEQIEKLLDRKFRGAPADEKTRRRAANLLARYGYGWGDIKAALSRFDE